VGLLLRTGQVRHRWLTPVGSQSVTPPRVLECPIQMEGIVHDFRPFGKNVNANVFEVHIAKLHVDENLLLENGSRPAYRPGALAPPDHELLPVFRTRRRGASVASGSIRLHEARDPGTDLAAKQFTQDTPMEVTRIIILRENIGCRSIWSKDAKAVFPRLLSNVL
jgi:hypothetical protein